MWLRGFYDNCGEGQPLIAEWSEINDMYRDRWRRRADAIIATVLDALIEEAERNTCNDCVMVYSTDTLYHTTADWLHSFQGSPQ